MTDEATRKRRARWQRNKEAERTRSKGIPASPTPQLIARIEAERDRRANEFTWDHASQWRGSSIFKDEVLEKAASFITDVWAAKALLTHTSGKATPTQIANKLKGKWVGSGYTESSLRPMIYRALARIELLETKPAWWNDGGPAWPLFDPNI